MERGWIFAGFIAAVYLTFQAYAPALHGPFVFDDFDLPLLKRIAQRTWPWLSGARPLLMFSYWVNYRLLQRPDLVSTWPMSGFI